MELGEKLKTLRLQNRLTLVELAEKSGVSKSLLSRIERGRSVPTITTIQKIASALGIILSDFFANSETEPSTPFANIDPSNSIAHSKSFLVYLCTSQKRRRIKTNCCRARRKAEAWHWCGCFWPRCRQRRLSCLFHTDRDELIVMEVQVGAAVHRP